MTQIRNGFHTYIASEMLDNILFQRSNFYYFLGKIDPWSTGDFSDIPINSYSEEEDNITRDDILYIRKVKSTDASIVTKSVEWNSGTVYDQWDHTQEMKGKPFFCINDDFDVYKCLFNNHGASSVNKPTSKSLLPFTTADGYIWKYMYNVPSFKRNKFLTPDIIPVQRSLTDGFYNKGAIEKVSVIEGGSGYVSVPQITIVVTGGGGTGAQLIPIVSTSTGSILGVQIKDGGTGYATAPVLSITPPSDGEGIYGNADAVLTAVVFGGSIVNVTIEDPGEGYPFDASTTIVATGDGLGAEFSPVLSTDGLGTIIGVIVENPGQDYTFITLSVVGAGTGAQLVANLYASDYISVQATIEQAAITQKGSIYAIKVTNPGNNYDNNTTVTITGDGTGATAVPVILGGGVTAINVTNYGTGYTYANVEIYNPNRELPNEYINAEAYAILPPIKGHGSNAVQELYGDTLCVYTQLKDDVYLDYIEQEYRQYGLLVDPVGIADNRKVTSEKYFIMFDLIFNTAAGLTLDSVLISNDVKYKIVKIFGTNVTLQQISTTYKPININDDFYYESDPETTYIVTSIISSPIVDKYSGNLLYVQNLPPFTPTTEQLIALRTYITL